VHLSCCHNFFPGEELYSGETKMPPYQITISNLPDDEDGLKPSPQEMLGRMNEQGFRPRVPGDFRVWIGNTNTMPEILEGAIPDMWCKVFGDGVKVEVVKRHESVTDEYIAKLNAGFLAAAEWVKAVSTGPDDWEETRKRMIGGTYPYVVAMQNVKAGQSREEIDLELRLRLTFGNLPGATFTPGE
jgi:hypothetical protein